MIWQGQAGSMDCGFAVLAMLCDQTTDETKAQMAEWCDVEERERTGLYPGDMERHLARHGWYWQRRYTTHGELTNARWAEFGHVEQRAYAKVVQATGNAHYVAIDPTTREPTVLDPLRAGAWQLEDWPSVQYVVAMVRP